MIHIPHRGLLACAAGLFAVACAQPSSGIGAGATDAAPDSAAEIGTDGASAALPSSSERLTAIVTAEHRRLAILILPEDLQSRDVAVRRAAARALARIGGDAARPSLFRALADEDLETVAWAAYGLGFWCKGDEKNTVSALVARAVSLPASVEGAAGPVAAGGAAAIARAIGKCGADASEPTLVAWLAGPRERAVAAAFALGDLPAPRQKLREETLVALLNLGAGSAAAPPVHEALYPIGRLESVPPTVVERIREVAVARLAEPGEARIFAVKALGRAGEEAATALEHVLTSPGLFTPSERAEAARSLKRAGAAGRSALERSISKLAPSAEPVALTALIGDEMGVLLTALGALEAPGSARKALRELAALPPPPSAPASIARRVSWIRCSAAKLVVGSTFTEPRITACDVTASAPAIGSIGARAIVEVLGRAPIQGARLTAWKTFALGGDIRAREAALELIETHDEIEGAAQALALALSAAEPGLVGTAAEVLSKQPQRAGEGKAGAPRERRGSKRKRKSDRDLDAAGADAKVEVPPPSPAVVKALLAHLPAPGGAPDPELVNTVIDAVGALGLKEALPALEVLCRSTQPTTREHAAKAIGLLASGGGSSSGKKTACDPPAEGGAAPAELAALAPGRVTLTFDSDIGELSIELDPGLAPVVVTRAAALAKSGYYNGMIVHRVVPGFVTQFGAPYGDGFGGPAGQPPLRCETSPLPFERDRVGIALSGRDTGSSQLFVMHARAPHLDGAYAIIGAASGPWASFVDGDILRSVKISP